MGKRLDGSPPRSSDYYGENDSSADLVVSDTIRTTKPRTQS